MLLCTPLRAEMAWKTGEEDPVGPKDNINLLFIGNSITAGATLSNASTQAPPIVCRALIEEATGVTTNVFNGGHSGITTWGYLPGRNDFTRIINNAKTFKKQNGGLIYFSIMLGTNDSACTTTEGAPVSPDTYANNIRTIIKALLEAVPDCKILLNYPIWYSPSTYNGAKYLQEGLDRLRSYYPMLDTIVAEYDQVFAGRRDVWEYFENNFALFMDNLVSVDPFSEVLSKPSRISLISKYLSPQKGEEIFIANTGFDVPCLFPDCNYKGYFSCEERIELWAFGQIYLFAKGIYSEIDTCVFYEGIGYKTHLPEKDSMDYIVYGTHEDTTYNNIFSLYETLAPNGRMLVFVDKANLQGKDEQYCELRDRLVKDRTISSIVSYSDNESLTGIDAIRQLLVIDKKENSVTNIISLPLGKEMKLESSKLNPDCLWPGYYFADRPENGVKLSYLATCPSRENDSFKQFKEFLGGKPQWEEVGDDIRLVLPEWMLNLSVAIASDLSSEYKDANLCNKDLLHVSDSSLDHWRSRMRVVENPCVLLAISGDTTRKLSLGFFDNVTERKFARAKGMPCLFPKEGIDVKYLAAILLLPLVREQLLAISEGSLYGMDFGQMLDLIVVPNNDEKERLKFLAETNYEALVSSQEELKQEAEYYRKSVRMRKQL